MNSRNPQEQDPKAETGIDTMFRGMSVPFRLDREQEPIASRPESHRYTAAIQIAVEGEAVSEDRILSSAARMGCARALDRLLVMTALKTLREHAYMRRLTILLSVVSSTDAFLAEFTAAAFAAQSVDPDRFAVGFPETTNRDCPEVRATLCRWESERFNVTVRRVAPAQSITDTHVRNQIDWHFESANIVH